jgi:hypothetical protein
MIITDLRKNFCRLAEQWKAQASCPRERSCFFASGEDPDGPAVTIEDFCRLMLGNDDPLPDATATLLGLEPGASYIMLPAPLSS